MTAQEQNIVDNLIYRYFNRELTRGEQRRLVNFCIDDEAAETRLESMGATIGFLLEHRMTAAFEVADKRFVDIHIPPAYLVEYSDRDGNLSSDKSSKIEKHLNQCLDCASELDMLKQVDNAFSRDLQTDTHLTASMEASISRLASDIAAPASDKPHMRFSFLEEICGQVIIDMLEAEVVAGNGAKETE